MTKPSPVEELTFEQAIERLEAIVAELDRGDLALEEALTLFQEGTALRETCERKLAEAEATVEQLLESRAPDGDAAPPTQASAESRAPAANPLFGDDDE
jgi:exodeoxyribonuclease VII small subunit